MAKTWNATTYKTASIWRLLLASTRPRQWTKNILVYFAFFFTANQIWDFSTPGHAGELFLRSTAAFLLFCLLSGATYLLNDVVDQEQDRLHPQKRHRPVASGRLPVPVALGASAALTGLALAASALLEPLLGVVAALYFALMLAYSLWLRQLVIVDVLTISAGFVLRAVAGAVVMDVPISPWLYACTSLGALLLVFGKRRAELAAGGQAATVQRKALREYTVPLLDQFLGVVATATLVAYTLYSFTAENLPQNRAMMLTIPLVVYGIFRYLYLIHRRGLGEAPDEILLTDVPLLVDIGLWLALSAAVLLVFR